MLKSLFLGSALALTLASPALAADTYKLDA